MSYKDEILKDAEILLFWIAADTNSDVFRYHEAKKIKAKYWEDEGHGTDKLLKSLQKNGRIKFSYEQTGDWWFNGYMYRIIK